MKVASRSEMTKPCASVSSENKEEEYPDDIEYVRSSDSETSEHSEQHHASYSENEDESSDTSLQVSASLYLLVHNVT